MTAARAPLSKWFKTKSNFTVSALTSQLFFLLFFTVLVLYGVFFSLLYWCSYWCAEELLHARRSLTGVGASASRGESSVAVVGI